MTAPVRVVCVRCAGRYALVVDPDCPLCGGRGTVAVIVGDLVQPWVAARALGLHLGDYWGATDAPTDRVRTARRLPLLADDDETAAGLPDQPAQGDARNATGRAAGAWLLAVGLRQRKPRKAAKRITAEERAGYRRRMAEARQRREESRRQFEEEHKRRRIEAKAAEALRALHPDEFEEMVEREGPMLAMEEMWWA